MTTALLTAAQAAELLNTASASGKPIAPLRERLAQADLDTAYAIQNHNTEHALAQGRRLVGR
ncbi:MAG: hypothetical protein L6Q58_15645, partial [Rivicola pingtungensis]|nr:hypothetical protein [Rivihabitans pingtungensis]